MDANDGGDGHVIVEFINQPIRRCVRSANGLIKSVSNY